MELSFFNLSTIELGMIAFFILMPLIAVLDILRSEFKDQGTKLLWIVIVLLAPFLGCIIYFLVGRNQKVSRYY